MIRPLNILSPLYSRSPARRANKVASLQSLAKENLTCRTDLTSALGNCLEKSKSDSRLNNKSAENKIVDSGLSIVMDNDNEQQDEAIKRSVSQNVIPSGKKSPKKSTKKSKSYPKLGEVDPDVNCSPTGHLAVAKSSGGVEMKLMKRLKKSPMARLKNSRKGKEEVLVVEVTEEGATERCSAELHEMSVSSAGAAMEGGELDGGYEDDEEDTSLESDILPVTSLQEYSILEQCIRQYETFYQVFVSRQLFSLIDGARRSSEEEDASSVDKTVDDGEAVLDEYAAGSLYELKDHVVVDSQRENQLRMEKIDKLFETLLVERRAAQTELNRLLEESMPIHRMDRLRIVENGMISRDELQQEMMNQERRESDPKTVKRLMDLKLYESLRSALKLAANLLVELSTFPNYNQHASELDGQQSYLQSWSTIPHWLRVLAIAGCYLRSDKEIQINCISTLFELVSLLQAQYEPQTLANPGVTYVVMLPLMRVGHIRVLERETRVFPLLTSVLWDYLADESVDRFQVTSLLYQLHASLEQSGTVESVIGHRLTNTHTHWQFDCERMDEDDEEEEGDENGDSDDEWPEEGKRSSRREFRGRLERYAGRRMTGVKELCPVPVASLITCNDYLDESETSAFRKFELLWHLGRERTTSRGFDKIQMQVSGGQFPPYI